MEKRKNIKLLIASAIMLALCVPGLVWAIYDPAGVSAYFTPYAKAVSGFLSGMFSALPFSLGELLIYGAILFLLIYVTVTVVRLIKGGGIKTLLSFFSRTVFIVAILVFIFIYTFGLNYFALPLSELLDMDVQSSSAEELYEATEYYLEQANEYSERVERDESGLAALGSFDELAGMAELAYTNLSKENLFFKGTYSKPKRVTSWLLMSYMGLTGMYIPFTGECNVNPDTYIAALPFTMEHELAHRLGIAPENEANFTAFLACKSSERVEYQYSGYYMAYIYCNNALAKADKKGQVELWNRASKGLKADLLGANKHYAKYNGPVQEVSDAVNSAYLKTLNQPSGVKSYGEVVDLLIAYYKACVNF